MLNVPIPDNLVTMLTLHRMLTTVMDLLILYWLKFPLWHSLALLSECLQKSERKRIPDIFPGIGTEIQCEEFQGMAWMGKE